MNAATLVGSRRVRHSRPNRLVIHPMSDQGFYKRRNVWHDAAAGGTFP